MIEGAIIEPLQGSESEPASTQGGAPLTLEALGHSIIDKELKGDFAVAGRLADEMVEKARRHRDPTTLGEALLERDQSRERSAAQSCNLPWAAP